MTNPKFRFLPLFHSTFVIRYSIFLFGFSPFVGIGQQPDFPTAASPTTQFIQPEPLDTTPLYASFCQQPEVRQPVGDTLPDRHFRTWNPTRKQPVGWADLGNSGSATRPLFFENTTRTGFQPGLEAFKLYEKRPDDLPFYRNSRAFTEAFHSQGTVQNDNAFHGKFARTFDGGLSLSVDYQTLNGFGQYRTQRTKNAALLIGGWLPVGPRWQGFLVFSQNNHKQQENGGIINEADFGLGGTPGGANEIRTRQTEPVPVSTLRSSEIQFTQHLDLLKRRSKIDSLPSFGRPQPTVSNSTFRISHSASFENSTFKFYDSRTTADSNFYGPFWVDERGLRHFLQTQKLENDFSINGSTKAFGFSAGLRHAFWKIQQEPISENRNDIFLTGKIGLQLSNRLKINGVADLGLLKNIGEYSLRSDLFLNLGPVGIVRGELLQQRRQPTLLSQRVFVNQLPIWQNDFLKIFETTLGGSFENRRLGFRGSVRNHLVNNFIYWTNPGLPSQTGEALNVLQVIVNQDFKWRSLRFDNQFVFQKTNRRDLLHQPEWMSRNSLYFDSRIFKRRMHLAAGADFRINQPFQADGWQPLASQFYLQSDSTVAIYPAIDLFISFKVESFRFFVRFENLAKFWETDIFYQTQLYPQPRAYLRFGATFRWLDGKNDRKNESSKSSGSGSGGPPPGVRGGSGRPF